MKFVGIDYGQKKTGIALSDDSGTLSFPKVVVPTKELENFLDTLLKEEHIDGFVVGHSVNQKGEDNTIALSAKKLGDALALTYNIPVHYEKEFFTSVFARQFQEGKHNNNARKVKQKEIGNVDAHAAAILLQRFLDKRTK